MYKLNHRSAPDCTWQTISPTLNIRNGIVQNGFIAHIVTVNWVISLQCSVYIIHVPWVNSPPKLFFKEFCISHSTRWGYHHSPCDSLSLLLRYIIIIFNYSISQHQVKYTYIIQILKNTYIPPNAQYSYLDINVQYAYMDKPPWLKHDYSIDEQA